MEREAEQAVEREVRIEASPEVVFQYFVDPARMVEWKGKDAALDARPGGIYRVSVTDRDIARGEYVEVVPHSRIVFTWGWEATARAFAEAALELAPLTTLPALLEVAAESGQLPLAQRALIEEWVADPQGWGEKHAT